MSLSDWRTTPYAQAVDTLTSIRRSMQDSREFNCDSPALTSYPGYPAAVLSFLYHGCSAAGPVEPPGQQVWDTAAYLILCLDDDHVRILLDEVLFLAKNPAVYHLFAPAIQSRVPAADAERAILSQLRSGNPLAVRNAREFAYYTFGSNPGYRLSEEGRRLLEQSGK